MDMYCAVTLIVDSRAAEYMCAAQTIRITDLLTNATLATISHDTRIDWLVRCASMVFACVRLGRRGRVADRPGNTWSRNSCAEPRT